MTYTIHKDNRNISGKIVLTGSKSISNRALIIRALSGEDFPIHRLASANDTDLMQALLTSDEEVRDAGPAGTTFRFLTAYLALQPGSQVLTGTERMKQRPIGVLVDALRKLGANIEYLEKEGYPPLRIGEAKDIGESQNQLSIPASTSSQYISALLMIAPTLANGLELTLEGDIVSRSYIELTLGLMQHFGIKYTWEGAVIKIPAQKYESKPFTVEADWSAASYYYAMAAFADELDLELEGLFPNSAQGDAVLAEMMEKFGIKTTFTETGVKLTKSAAEVPPFFEWDFILCPDVAQTLAVICAGLGTHGLFTGLQTLRIKETDRIAALQTELAKVNVFLSKLPERFAKESKQEYYSIEGKAIVNDSPLFPTYEDHRMAMAFAPLAMLGPIQIEDPMVVNKSYPEFWEDLEKLGFVVKK